MDHQYSPMQTENELAVVVRDVLRKTDELKSEYLSSRKNPQSAIQSRIEESVKEQFTVLLDCFDNIYHNKAYESSLILPDDVYDIVRDTYESLFPGERLTVGAPGESDVKLPFYMGSMDKVNAHNDTGDHILKQWLKKFSNQNPFGYTLEAKADGMAAEIVLSEENGKWSWAMYTRGTNTHGSDISHLLQFLVIGQRDRRRNLPQSSRKFKFPSLMGITSNIRKLAITDCTGAPAKRFAIRGELIMPQDIWEQEQASNPGAYTHARGFASSVRTRKDGIREHAMKLVFVAFEILDPRPPPYSDINEGAWPVDKAKKKFSGSANACAWTMKDQLRILEDLGLYTIERQHITWSDLFAKGASHDTKSYAYIKERLSTVLNEFRERSPAFEYDGLVVFPDAFVFPLNTSGNPKWAFAFKFPDCRIQVEVTGVTWSTATDGGLAPTIHYTPTRTAAGIRHACTGRHAAFIRKYRIHGPYEDYPGSKIVVSGGTIPNIEEGKLEQLLNDDLIEGEPELPNADWGENASLRAFEIPYEWGEGGKGKRSNLRIFVKIDQDKSNPTVKKALVGQATRQMLKFFSKKGLEVMGVGPATIHLLYDAGFTSADMVLALVQEEPETFVEIFENSSGKESKTGKKLLDGMTKMLKKKVSLSRLAYASQVFSKHQIGEKKFALALKKYPIIGRMIQGQKPPSTKDLDALLAKALLDLPPGVGEVKMRAIVHDLLTLYSFVRCGQEDGPPSFNISKEKKKSQIAKKTEATGPLSGSKFVLTGEVKELTGSKDQDNRKNLEELLIGKGAKIVSNGKPAPGVILIKLGAKGGKKLASFLSYENGYVNIRKLPRDGSVTIGAKAGLFIARTGTDGDAGGANKEWLSFIHFLQI